MTRCRNDAADLAAVARCGRGDARAIEELYEHYAGSCLALARSVLGDPDEATEAVREAFLDLWRHADRFDPSPTSVRARLHLLTHRKAVDRVRSERRQSFPLAGGEDGEAERAGSSVHASGAIIKAPTRQVLAALPAAQRQALVLAYWGGYSQRDISMLTSTPLGTVKSRMLTAMKDLQRMIENASAADERLPHGSVRQPALDV